MDRITDSFCGINLFTYENYIDVEMDEIYFYDVMFIPLSMRKYNGMGVSKFLDGRMKIWKDQENVWEGFVTDIPEIMRELNNRTRKKEQYYD